MKDFFADAAKTRVRITKAQSRAIAQMYKDLSGEIAKEAQGLGLKANVSSIIRKSYLDGLSKQINQELRAISTAQNLTIRSNMNRMAAAVVASNQKFLNKIGFNIKGAYSYVPSDVVKEIASGNLYEGRWNLSSAIWKNTVKTQSDINMIVAKGVAGQKSTYEIAKDLEAYVNPNKRKDWQWAKVYPGTAKVVDYSAQRLARTMISHAYQDSFVRTTQKNPFVTEYRWLASGGDRMCEICAERDGQVYEKDELPLDHPNGMCTFEAVIPDSYEAIADRLADWVKGNDDPDLDEFAYDLGYSRNTLKGKVI